MTRYSTPRSFVYWGPYDYDDIPDNLEFKFTFLGKKKRRGENDIYWNDGIMDGGYYISGSYDANRGLYTVEFVHKGFAFDSTIDFILFKVEKGKEYTVYLDRYRGKLFLKGGNFKRWRKPEPEPESESDSEPKTDAFGNYIPNHMLPLIRLANPQTVSDKIFTEFVEEVHTEDSIHYIKPTERSTAWLQ